MILLAPGDTLAAGASAASQVTSTVFGMELFSSVETYKVLDQRQLAVSPTTIYTAPASTQAFIRSIMVVNNDTVARTAQYYRGGTAASNAITPAVSIPPGGLATYEDGKGWQVFQNVELASRGGQNYGSLNGVTRVDIVPAPAAGFTRVVESIRTLNLDTVKHTIRVYVTQIAGPTHYGFDVTKNLAVDGKFDPVQSGVDEIRISSAEKVTALMDEAMTTTNPTYLVAYHDEPTP